MTDEKNSDAVEFVDSVQEDEEGILAANRYSEAVVHSTDWTTDTIVSQIKRGNILLKPRFQRRDAWKLQHKSRFIESLVLGLPIPPIVLAEAKDQRGKFIVLDGKQRLLSLLQFWGLGDGANNSYSLTGLQVLTELNRKSFSQLEADPAYAEHLSSLINQPIRTVVIKNWPSTDFLHLVFLRLNTGSVKLSPQELRQAIVPGPFTDWIDESAMRSAVLKDLLKLDEPDSRMRDVELLARYFAFRHFLSDYRGRMKEFLDFSFQEFNQAWAQYEGVCEEGLRQFEQGVESLRTLFGESLAKKPGGRLFNKAVFDFLIFYAQREDVRAAQGRQAVDLRQAYVDLFRNAEFVAAVERDTAGLPNTVARLSAWGSEINRICGLNLPLPVLVAPGGEQRIELEN